MKQEIGIRDISWQEFETTTRLLAAKLTISYRCIIAVTRGGLVPAAILSHILDIKMIDTVCVETYEDKEAKRPRTFKTPMMLVFPMLVVDELVDTGATARAIRENIPRHHYVAVYAKPVGAGFTDFYGEMVPQNCWLNFPWETKQ